MSKEEEPDSFMSSILSIEQIGNSFLNLAELFKSGELDHERIPLHIKEKILILLKDLNKNLNETILKYHEVIHELRKWKKEEIAKERERDGWMK